MSKAAELAALIGSQSALSNRNLIINGAMQVAQRGTSSTSLHTSGYYTTDRFALVFGNEDELRVTMSQNSVTDLPGFANSLKVQTTTAESAIAADESYYIINRYEGQDFQQLKYGTSSALSTTLSFYVKSSVTGTFAVAIYQTDGNDIIGSTYTINSADTWEKKEITFAGNTLAAIVDDNTNAIMIDWFLAAGSNFTSVNNTSWGGYETGKLAFGHGTNAVATTTNATWEITGVQWELGEQATPFEHRSFHDELARCQRYYWQVAGASQIVGQGFYYSTSEFDCIVNLPQTMRAAPTFTSSNNSGDFQVTNISDAFDTWTAQQFFDGSRVNVYTTSGVSGTKGDSGYVRHMNSTSKIQFDAEL